MEKTEIIKEEIAYKRYTQFSRTNAKYIQILADCPTKRKARRRQDRRMGRSGDSCNLQSRRPRLCRRNAISFRGSDRHPCPGVLSRSGPFLLSRSTGPDAFLYTVPAGMFDVRKHSSPQEAAEHEMSEEARLERGKWYGPYPSHAIDQSGRHCCTKTRLESLI